MAHFIHVVTLALSLIYQASGKRAISDDLSFDCTANGSMMIFVSKPGMYGSVYANGANNITCSVEKHDERDSLDFEIKGCNIKEAVRVIVMHVIQSGSLDDVIIGGENASFFELQCNEVPLGAYIINRTANLIESTDKTYTMFSESPLYLTMEIIGSNLSPLRNDVIVGSKLYLVLSGNDEFEFRAETCIASDGSHKHNKTLIRNGLSVEMYIISNFSSVPITTVSPHVSSASQSKHSIEAILYAFHFANSHDVEIMCIITVCQKDDNTCSLTSDPPISTTPSTSGRRRRDTLGLPQIQTFRTTFRVVDQFGDNNDIVKTSGAVRRQVFWLPLAFLAKWAVRTLM